MSTGSYTSDLGYTITAPSGWLMVDASNVGGMKPSLPGNIRADMLSRADVVFFPNFTGSEALETSKQADDARREKNKEALEGDPNMPKEELLTPVTTLDNPPEFSPMVTILSVKTTPDPKPEGVKAYEKQILKTAGERLNAEGFKIVNSTYNDALSAGSAYLFNVEFRHQSRLIAAEQTLVFHGEQTLIVTCIQDSNEYQKDKNWCSKMVSSLKFGQ